MMTVSPAASVAGPVQDVVTYMSKLTHLFLALVTLLTAASITRAQGLDPLAPLRGVAPVSSAPVTATAIPSHTQVAPGQTFYVAIDIRIASPWAYYSPSPGDNGVVKVLPAKLEVDVGPLRAGAVLWPPHHAHETAAGGEKLLNNVYQGRAVAFVPVTVPQDASGTINMSFRLGGQVCGLDRCVMVGMPQPVVATAEVTVAAQAAANAAWTPEIAAGLDKAAPVTTTVASTALPPSAAPLTLWAGFGTALLAGLLLNIMPCVLPVIPLRILSIVQMARQSRRRYITLGIAFAAGMVAFFAALALANVGLRLATGQALNWAQHFQHSSVRTALALVVVAMAANLFGLFTVLVPKGIAGIESRGQGHLASVGMGFMMAVLATPCSFPFLAAAFTWAVGQPIAIGTAAIILMGVGMAAPHALLAAFPGLVAHLPRPGRWMEIFRQSMGFVLLGAAVWLISTVTDPFWTAGYALALCFPLWMWGSWVRYDTPTAQKIFIRSLAIVIAIGAGIVMLKPAKADLVNFQPYSESSLVAASAEGRPVMVKFTATWCLSCQLLDLTVFDDHEVAAEVQKLNVLALKADVTNAGPAHDTLYGRYKSAVPLTVIHPPAGGEPIFLPGEFSKADLIAALQKAAEKKQH